MSRCSQEAVVSPLRLIPGGCGRGADADGSQGSLLNRRCKFSVYFDLVIVNRIAKIIAYFVTTRLWYILHSIINTRQLQTRTSANFLSRSAHCSCPPQGQFHHFCSYRLWWWRLIVWYEENVKAPVPYKFEIPNPSFSLTRVRDPSRDI